MILKRLNYFQNKGTNHYWEIKDLHFGMLNLVIGINATGKTRMANIIINLAKIISKKTSEFKNGNWDIEFVTDNGKKVRYELDIENQVVVREELKSGKKILLKRERNSGKIYSYLLNKKVPYNPPINELTLHVRRDLKEYPFLEDLAEWGNSLLGFNFTTVDPGKILIPVVQEQKYIPFDLTMTPYLLRNAIEKDEEIIQSLISDFSSIGYPINNVGIRITNIPGGPSEIPLAFVKEKDLLCSIDQTNMSQGMYRAFSLIVIIEHLKKIENKCTVVIDDLGEGLDFDRSSKLTELLLEKLKSSNVQLIMTSNDRFLINATDIEHLNILERKGHNVRSFNYYNSKKLFNDFKFTGLNNFDLLSGEMYKNIEN